MRKKVLYEPLFETANSQFIRTFFNDRPLGLASSTIRKATFYALAAKYYFS